MHASLVDFEQKLIPSVAVGCRCRYGLFALIELGCLSPGGWLWIIKAQLRKYLFRVCYRVS